MGIAPLSVLKARKGPEERDILKSIPKLPGGDNCGQTTVQLVAPLVIVLFLLLAVALVLPKISSTQTLFLTAGLVIFVLSFASTDLALYILIFSMLLSPEFVVGSTEGGTLGRGVTLRADDFLIVIIGLSWIAKMSIKKELGLFLKTPLNKPIAFYILVCLVSTLFGAMFDRVQLKTGFFYVLKYFEYMIIYFMVVNHLEKKTQVRNYFYALLLTGAIVSIIGIAQIPSGARVSAPFEGEFGEPNTLGGYLVLMISVTLGVFLSARGGRSLLSYAILTFLFFIPLIYTQSRSSYLAIIPAVLVFIWISEKRHWVLLGVALIGVCLPFIAPKAAKERIQYTFTQGRDRTDVVEIYGVKLDTSTSARLKNWRDASKDWIKHPFLGFGVTGYGFVDTQYFRVVTETGFLGLLTFFLLLVTMFRQTLSVCKTATDPLHKGLATGFLAGFVGMLFHSIGANTFIIVRIMEPFWFLAAIVVMIPQIEKNHEEK